MLVNGLWSLFVLHLWGFLCSDQSLQSFLYDFNHQGRLRDRWGHTNFLWLELFVCTRHVLDREDHTIDNISLVIYPVYPVLGTKFACISCILTKKILYLSCILEITQSQA